MPSSSTHPVSWLSCLALATTFLTWAGNDPASTTAVWAFTTTTTMPSRSTVVGQKRRNLARSVATTEELSTQQPPIQQPEDNDETPPQGLTVEFPPPLTPLQRTARALSFYKRVLPVLAAYKTKQVELEFRRNVLSQDISAEQEDQIWADLDEWGSQRVAATIQEMKGFYVKTGQVVSTRVDLFPEAYTNKLQQLQDGLDAMPFELVEQVVRQELLDGAPLSDLFLEFETEPLGSASIAQVHRAKLLDGRVVAVKLQRPNVEPKLQGDVANLKRISKALRDSLPVDYYTVFCELGEALQNELDFLAEAQAMKKIHLAVNHRADGSPSDDAPVTIPLPVGELVSKRVLVMDFVEGVPLNKLSETMKERGIVPGSPQAKIAGQRILSALAVAFGRMIIGAGFCHGDPHPGNIFIGEGGKVSLIDCGQFKSLPRSQRIQLAKIILAVNEYQQLVASSDSTSDSIDAAKQKLATLVQEFGVVLVEDTPATDEDESTTTPRNDVDLFCSVALFLFGDSDKELPGGYSTNELDDNSPIKLIASFPQELVLLGRATVLLKGIAKKLEVPFSLAEQWSPACQMTVEATSEPTLPLWSKSSNGDIFASTGASSGEEEQTAPASGSGKIRFREVTRLAKDWGKGKSRRALERAVKQLPPKLQTRILEAEVKRQEGKSLNV